MFISGAEKRSHEMFRRNREDGVKLPPGQSPIRSILRWGIDHPGITPSLPQVPKEDWRLNMDGDVEKQLSLGWADILALPQTESISDFHCVEGWSVLAQRWRGVKFRDLQEAAVALPSARFALLSCADGYTTSLPLSELQGDDIIIAYSLNGEELPQPLGGPLRLVVPQKYAYKSAMWINRVTFSAEDRLGFWERGYYSNTADIWSDDRFRTDR